MENPYNPFDEILREFKSIHQELRELKSYLQPQEGPAVELPDTIKVKEAAKETNYQPGYVYQKVSEGSIPYFRLKSGAIRFSRKELRAWMIAGRPDVMQQAITSITDKATKKNNLKRK